MMNSSVMPQFIKACKIKCSLKALTTLDLLFLSQLVLFLVCNMPAPFSDHSTTLQPLFFPSSDQLMEKKPRLLSVANTVSWPLLYNK